jgi:hypothetical protein
MEPLSRRLGTDVPAVASRGSALRPVVATVEVVAIGAAAHVGAGGSLPSTGHLLALVGLVGATSLALHHRLVRAGAAVAVALSGQLLLHTLGSGAAAHAAHGAHHAAGDGTAVAGWQMVLAHALGAAVTATALLWQEQLVVVITRALRLGRRTAPPSYDVPRPPTGARPLGVTTVRVLALAPHRGPPVAEVLAVS